MFRRSRARGGLLLVCGLVGCLLAGRASAGPPAPAAGPYPEGPVPGLYVGSDSRGYPYYPGYRWYPAYPLYRAYPEYNGYPFYPGLSYAAGYQPPNPYLLECLGLRPALWAFPDYYSGHYPAYYAGTPDYRRGGPGLPPLEPDQIAPGSRASISVQVPAGAEVWFDGRKMTVNGPVRRFHTPPLPAGGRYTYDVTARWQENGRPATRSQAVFVTAGADVDVVFPTPPAVAGVK